MIGKNQRCKGVNQVEWRKVLVVPRAKLDPFSREERELFRPTSQYERTPLGKSGKQK